jgi:hypothetical protein
LKPGVELDPDVESEFKEALGLMGEFDQAQGIQGYRSDDPGGPGAPARGRQGRSGGPIASAAGFAFMARLEPTWMRA